MTLINNMAPWLVCFLTNYWSFLLFHQSTDLAFPRMLTSTLCLLTSHYPNQSHPSPLFHLVVPIWRTYFCFNFNSEDFPGSPSCLSSQPPSTTTVPLWTPNPRCGRNPDGLVSSRLTGPSSLSSVSYGQVLNNSYLPAYLNRLLPGLLAAVLQLLKQNLNETAAPFSSCL